ncbi:regulator of Vps4 activity in the MVB pathway-domain-containing protein [Lipomyces oligophaga]|uniref:regulator of Vps4 activity in the MVB pathway-domain-containing protein n=1 Tax=Lipomyces oligophaga TaxID=45792 RepID=UPI0034CF7945
MPPQVPNQLTTRLKIQLKLSISRLRYIQQKESAISKQQRRDVAQLLSDEKTESARIRVENVIRQEINSDLLEVLELYCELLLARIGLLDQRRECDPGLQEAVKSIIYAAGRTDVKELQQVRDMMIMKFGKEFARDALENPEISVAPRVYKKLSIEPPNAELVTAYLEEISRTYRIPWSGLPEDERLKLIQENDPEPVQDDHDHDHDDQGGGSGGLGEVEPGMSLPSIGDKSLVPPIVVAPVSAGSDIPRPNLTQQGTNNKSGSAVKPIKKDALPDLDELSKRFAALKR